MKKYFIHTFWCSMNQADSEKINMILLQSGLIKTIDWKQADLIVLNTCSVRQKWEDKVIWLLEEIKNYKNIENKKIITAITGCMVRKTWINNKYLKDNKRDKNKAKEIKILENKEEIFNNDDKLFPRLGDKLDMVFRIEDIKYIPFILTHISWESIWKEHSFDDYLKQKQLRENKSQAIIIIQTWCDNFCSYCIVPQTRWKEISRKMEDILQEAKDLVDDWVKEITLVWQNVNSYWKEFIDKKYWNKEKSKWNEGLKKSPFRELLEKLDNLEWLDRIRFTSSNPHDMTKDILDAHFELNKTCNYLHFALQSWNDEMLKKMNRRHNYSDFKKMVDYLRSKDKNFSISTDIIVWYSGETEDMFNDTKVAYEECEFDFVYNARYSVRKGTIAEKIYPDDISSKTKAERWHILNNLLLSSVEKRNKLMLGKIEEVLIWWEKEEQFYWRTRNFKEVFFNKKIWKNVWDIVKVKIISLNKYVLLGELIS